METSKVLALVLTVQFHFRRKLSSCTIQNHKLQYHKVHRRTKMRSVLARRIISFQMPITSTNLYLYTIYEIGFISRLKNGYTRTQTSIWPTQPQMPSLVEPRIDTGWMWINHMHVPKYDARYKWCSLFYRTCAWFTRHSGGKHTNEILLYKYAE